MISIASLIGFLDTANVSKSHVDDIAQRILKDYDDIRRHSDATNDARREQNSDGAASQDTSEPTPPAS
jgi:hypothetical protein